MSGRSSAAGPDPTFDPDRLIDAAAPLLGLSITPEQRPGVVRFLAVARGMADVVFDAPVPPDTADLAPVFAPHPRTER